MKGSETMSTSMTKGNPLKLMLQFALPLLIGNLLQQTYNIIDAAIVGQILGAKALASVGASSSVQFLVLGFCMGCCTGFGVPVAKYFGAEKMDTMRNYVFNGAVLTGGIGVTVTILCSVFCPQILHLLSVPEDIFRGAYHYLLIIFLGIPFTLLYNYLSSILRSLGDSRTPFLFLAFSAILNIFLDLFCIVVLKWGCAGAAAATITAQASSGILCLVFIGRKMNVLHLTKENRMVNITAVKELLAMGLPTGLQFSITAIGSMVMQSANNGLGRLRQGVAIATIYGLLIGLVLIFGGRTLSMIFVKKSAADVLDASGKYLRCLGYFFWSLGILNVSRMVTQGLGYSGRAVLSGVTEMLARTIVSLGFVGALGYTAICFADQAAWIAACCYIAPTCLHCVKKVTGILEGNGNR